MHRAKKAIDVCAAAGTVVTGMVRLRVAALVALLVCARPAAGLEDELLPGTTLALRQGRKGDRVLIVAAASVSAPIPGGTDDPRLTGARVDIGTPITREWARLDAPAAGWSVNAVGTLFRFRNASPKDRRDEPLTVVIRHGKRIKIVGRALGITLDEPAQQRLAVILTSGSRRYCLVFGGTLRRDEPGRFVAHAAPVPDGCLAAELPAQTTSTTTTTIPRIPGGSTTSTTTTTKVLPPTTTSTTLRADPCDGLDVPSGHRPPHGQCRIWYPGRSPGHQPPPGDCHELAGAVPDGACLVRG
jgi:hypothetical protein